MFGRQVTFETFNDSLKHKSLERLVFALSVVPLKNIFAHFNQANKSTKDKTD